MTSLIILISGLPCTGKTTLAQKIAQKFQLPLISRDDIKESLFDFLGWQDREWSKKLGIASYQLLYYFIETQVSAGNSLIVESNFMPKFDNSKNLELKRKYNFYLLQIHCRADREALFQRFKVRSESGERHLGHVDSLNYDEFNLTLNRGGYDALEASDRVLEIDTTDFARINYCSLFESIGDRLIKYNR